MSNKNLSRRDIIKAAGAGALALAAGRSFPGYGVKKALRAIGYSATTGKGGEIRVRRRSSYETGAGSSTTTEEFSTCRRIS